MLFYLRLSYSPTATPSEETTISTSVSYGDMGGGKGVIFGLLHSGNTQRKYIKFILYRQEAVLFFGHFCLFLGIDRETDKVKTEN